MFHILVSYEVEQCCFSFLLGVFCLLQDIFHYQIINKNFHFAASKRREPAVKRGCHPLFQSDGLTRLQKTEGAQRKVRNSLYAPYNPRLGKEMNKRADHL